MKLITVSFMLLFAAPVTAAETVYPDLPTVMQVTSALGAHANVMVAETGVKIERVNQRKWEGGTYEFNLRADMAQRKMSTSGQNLDEWNVALERPVRLPNKMFIDSDIGAEGVRRAGQVLGDAYHEAGRVLLHLWFGWSREQAQTLQWQQQVELLVEQASTTEKRLRAGDAPKMEWNQAQAAVSQARVALKQARMRAELASAELIRQFPGLNLPQQLVMALPQPIEHDLAYWKQQILDDNHELGMVQSEKRIQQMLAERSRADRIPDPTIGLHYSSEMSGNEKVTGIYVVVPLSTGIRGINEQHAQHLAEVAGDREMALAHRLQGDIYAVYTQATESYEIWLQAKEAAENLRKNAALSARAYQLGENSLSETLAARRLAIDATLTENIAQLDANEARYRLLLDAHLLWTLPGHDEHESGQH